MPGDDILIAVTLSTPTKDIGIENKDSAPTTPYDNQVPLETELIALKSFVLEQFFLIKKSIQEIKNPNYEAANSTYIAMLMEQIEYLKEGSKVKNSIIQSLTNQHINIFNNTTTSRSNNNNDNNSNTTTTTNNNNNENDSKNNNNNNDNNNNLHKNNNNNLRNTSNNNNINNSSNNNNNNFSGIKSVSNNNNKRYCLHE